MRKVTLGLLGCGTVGSGVLRLLSENADKLAAHVGARLALGGVLVRDLHKERVAECDRALLTSDGDAILRDPNIDVVVEVMGGEAAYDFVAAALEAGKNVVTANKLLIATRGDELLARAVNKNVDLAFEGAVGGGIPIVRTLRESFASDQVWCVSGIVNGTCNYVLTRMQDEKLALADAVKYAQELGYAEADPSMDVDGHDAAHKLHILALLAFGAWVPPGAVEVEGIREIEAIDHRFASRFGYRIKHLVIGRDHGTSLELRVHPTLVPKRSVIANVSGVHNGVLVDGRALGPCLVTGRGAGSLPTAVSVVSDVLDVARSVVAGVSGLQTRAIQRGKRALLPIGEVTSRYYIRFTVRDEPGVMAKLAGALGDALVSIEQMVQDAEPGEGGATVVMITHRAREAAVQSALAALAGQPFMARKARLVRIEEL
jgi:homoserine dehydrogenase